MTFVAFIRHGETQWNAERRMQGRADIPLSEESCIALRSLRAPVAFRASRWHVSPLGRAIESARLLGPGAFRIEPRLTEMDWGEWEGETLCGLRARLGGAMQENEDRGLHFRPPGGESPADVQVRLKSWFGDIANPGRPVTALTHKGVIRAALALAYDWDMLGKPPVKLDWAAAHLFDASPTGVVVPVALNITLEPKHG
ncbi:MAG: histidine phosphatase family protein [Alphaproteobacteria bacterium]